MLKFDMFDGYTYDFKNAIVTDVKVEILCDDPLLRSYKITAHDGPLHSGNIEQTKQETNPYSVRSIQFNKNKNVTTVIWEDGSITMVKKKEEDPWDEQAAFCAALAKKVYGSTSKVKKMIEEKGKTIEEEEMSFNDAIKTLKKALKDLEGK